MIGAAIESASNEPATLTGLRNDALDELIQAVEEHPEIAWMLRNWGTSPLASASIRLQNALTAGKAASRSR